MAPAPSPGVDLRPLSTGELIDRGFALYRRNFTGLLLLALLSQASMFLAQVISGMLHLQPSMADLIAQVPHAMVQAGILSLIVAVALLISFFFGVVMTMYVADAYLGQSPSLAKSFRQGLGLAGGAFWTCALKYMLYLLSILFPILGGAAIEAWYIFFPPANFARFVFFIFGSGVLGVASLVPVLVVVMRLMVTTPALALERLAGWASCRRSSTLVRYDPGLGFFYWGETRLSLLLLPLFVIELLTSTLTGVPIIISEINDVLQHGTAVSFGMESDAVVIGSQVLTYLAGALIQPLYVIAVTLFYYDVRIRREGFDLEFLAGQLERTP